MPLARTLAAIVYRTGYRYRSSTVPYKEFCKWTVQYRYTCRKTATGRPDPVQMRPGYRWCTGAFDECTDGVQMDQYTQSGSVHATGSVPVCICTCNWISTHLYSSVSVLALVSLGYTNEVGKKFPVVNSRMHKRVKSSSTRLLSFAQPFSVGQPSLLISCPCTWGG